MKYNGLVQLTRLGSFENDNLFHVIRKTVNDVSVLVAKLQIDEAIFTSLVNFYTRRLQCNISTQCRSKQATTEKRMC